MNSFECPICLGLGRVDFISYARNDKQYFRERKKILRDIRYIGYDYESRKKLLSCLAEQLSNETDCPNCNGTGLMIVLETKEEIIKYISEVVMEELNKEDVI